VPFRGHVLGTGLPVLVMGMAVLVLKTQPWTRSASAALSRRTPQPASARRRPNAPPTTAHNPTHLPAPAAVL
jgi:hypothetical protein